MAEPGGEREVPSCPEEPRAQPDPGQLTRQRSASRPPLLYLWLRDVDTEGVEKALEGWVSRAPEWLFTTHAHIQNWVKTLNFSSLTTFDRFLSFVNKV